MSEEIDPQFTTCLVKKSKHYFKKELTVIGIIIAAFIFLMVLFFGIAWILTTLRFEGSYIWVLLLMDLAIFGGVAIACALGTDHMLINFIISFVKLHVIAATFIILLGFEMVCLVGIPFMAISLSWLIFSEVLGMGVIGGLISGIVIGIIVIPVNYSAFICLRIDPWVDEQWRKVLSWL